MQHKLYGRKAAKIEVIRSPKLWSSIGNSRDTKLGTKLELTWKLELNRKLELNWKLGMKLVAMADTATDTETVEALEITGASTLVVDACDSCISIDNQSADVSSDR